MIKDAGWLRREEWREGTAFFGGISRRGYEKREERGEGKEEGAKGEEVETEHAREVKERGKRKGKDERGDEMKRSGRGPKRMKEV